MLLGSPCASRVSVLAPPPGCASLVQSFPSRAYLKLSTARRQELRERYGPSGLLNELPITRFAPRCSLRSRRRAAQTQPRDGPLCQPDCLVVSGTTAELTL
jgi:hypothetical protein